MDEEQTTDETTEVRQPGIIQGADDTALAEQYVRALLGCGVPRSQQLIAAVPERVGEIITAYEDNNGAEVIRLLAKNS